MPYITKVTALFLILYFLKCSSYFFGILITAALQYFNLFFALLAERQDSPNECPDYDTKLHWMVRLQSWSLGRKLSTSLLLPLFLGPLRPGLIVPARVVPLGQIELFNHFQKIFFSYLKPYSCVQSSFCCNLKNKANQRPKYCKLLTYSTIFKKNVNACVQ